MKRGKPFPVAGYSTRPDEPVSWAGKGRDRGEICLGHESGRIGFYTTSLKPIGETSPVFGVGEAINGAAFLGWLGVLTTRAEVILFQPSDDGIHSMSIDMGASGVVSGRSKTIVAPAGYEGLFCIQPKADGTIVTGKVSVGDAGGAGDSYYYQTAYLGTDKFGREVFATACRSGGLAVHSVDLDDPAGVSGTWVRRISPLEDARDVVGVCSLNLPGHPLAVAMLTMDLAVHMSLDVLHEPFQATSSNNVEGTPYSIASAQGHVIILTSDSLYAIRDLAKLPTIAHDELHSPLIMNARPADAVDMAIVDNQYSILVMEDKVTSTSITEMIQRPGQSKSSSARLRDLKGTSAPALGLAGMRYMRSKSSSSKFAVTSQVGPQVRVESLVFS